MYSKAINPKASIFPSKKSMLKNDVKFKKIGVITNLYTPNIQKNIYITEWLMKIFKKTDEENQSQIKSFLQNPSSIEQDVNPDSRELIKEIVGSNIEEIKKKLKFGFYSGLMFYTLQKKFKEEYFVFENHQEYAIGLEKKNQGVGMDQLLANQDCRKHPLQILNSRIKHQMFINNYIEFGYEKKFYNIQSKSEIKQHGLELYQGYYFTLDLYESGLKMMADVSNRIVRMQSLWQYMNECLGKQIRSEQALKKFFNKNYTTMANYGNNKKFRIIDFDLSLSPVSKFPNPKYKTYLDYFSQKYQINSHQIDKNQFLVIAEIYLQENQKDGQRQQKQRVHLIPQLLKPTGLTDEQKNNFRVMKDISRYTIIRPNERKEKIENMIEKTFNNSQEKEQFQITFQLESNKISGYLVSKPQIQQKKGKTLTLKGDKIPLQNLKKTCDFSNWIIIYDFPNEQYLKALEQSISISSKKLGLDIKTPKKILLPKSQYFKNQKQATEFVKKFHEEEINEKPEIILYLVTKQTSKLLYEPVKKYYNKKSIQTQFIDSFNDKDTQNYSKVSNVLVQMNNKMGGRGWELVNNCPNTLVLGVESSIIQTGKDQREIVALCGQYGQNLTKYINISHSKLIKDIGRNTLNNLDQLVVEATKIYQLKKKSLPKKIILYRMGLGESQVQQAVNNEIIKLKNALAENFQRDAPKLISIMVNKQVKNRFYIQNQKGYDNPEGLLVMDDVVQQNRANFYLIPQKVNQGTATPCHYIVLDNDGCEMSLEKIIQLSMNLCYDYQNWNGPIRVPSVLQNANKLCAQQCQLKTDKITKTFNNKLFFL